MYKKTKKGWSKHFDFMLGDLVCLFVSFLFAYYFRNGKLNFIESSVYRHFEVIIIAIHIPLVFFAEPYKGVLRRGKVKEMKQVVGYNTLFLSVLVIYMFLIQKTNELSRIMIISFWIFSNITMYIARVLRKQLILARNNAPRYAQNVLVVTTWEHAESMVSRLKEHAYSGVVARGVVVTDINLKGQEIQGIPIVANLDGLLEFAKIEVVDHVLVDESTEETREYIEKLIEMGITVHINVDGLSGEYPNCMVERINGFNVITTSINVATDRQLFLKRAMDIAGSLVGLLFCGIAFVVVAPIIYIQSPGPIFFSQVRVGKNGRRFKIYKFRTMYLDAEARKAELMEQNEMDGLMFKLKNDPRIFPAGHVLRALSIDELPQFWNVFKGDMSLVGTRPPTVDEYEQYELQDKSRLAAQTGMTGMWQVSGRSDISDFKEVVKLDNEYIKNWSLGLDIKILFKTVLVVLGREGSR